MGKFTVRIMEVLTKDIIVEAEDRKKAEDYVNERYAEGDEDFVLSADDFDFNMIEVIQEE